MRPVEWLRTDVPRSVHQAGPSVLARGVSDLLPGQPQRGGRPDRRDRCDGSRPRNEGRGEAATVAQATWCRAASPDADVPNADESPIDLEEYARDRIAALIHEDFAGHRMAVLTEALLRAQGYTCWRSPEGADGGIDLLAGSGPLGLDAPQLVVQVKSEQSPVGDPVISQLLGTTTKHGPAAQGLLVAWGGLTPASATLGAGQLLPAAGVDGRRRDRPGHPALRRTTRGDPHRSAAQADLDRSGGARMIEPGRTYWYVNKPTGVDAAASAGVSGARAEWVSPTPEAHRAKLASMAAGRPESPCKSLTSGSRDLPFFTGDNPASVMTIHATGSGLSRSTPDGDGRGGRGSAEPADREWYFWTGIHGSVGG